MLIVTVSSHSDEKHKSENLWAESFFLFTVVLVFCTSEVALKEGLPFVSAK